MTVVKLNGGIRKKFEGKIYKAQAASNDKKSAEEYAERIRESGPFLARVVTESNGTSYVFARKK
jgi:hypothetical protein